MEGVGEAGYINGPAEISKAKKNLSEDSHVFCGLEEVGKLGEAWELPGESLLRGDVWSCPPAPHASQHIQMVMNNDRCAW